MKNISLHWLQGIFETVPKHILRKIVTKYFYITYSQHDDYSVLGGRTGSVPVIRVNACKTEHFTTIFSTSFCFIKIKTGLFNSSLKP